MINYYSSKLCVVSGVKQKPAGVARWSQTFKTTRSGAKVSTCGSNFFHRVNTESLIVSQS